MSVTDNYNLPLPDPSAASAKADVQKIRDALITLDDALANLNAGTYTKTEIDAAVEQGKTETKNELLGGAGAAHDTLQELAAELADDENAITSLTNLVGLKADSSALKALAYRDTVSASFIDPKSISNEHWVDNAKNIPTGNWDDVITNGFWMGSFTTNNPKGSDNRWWIGQVMAHNQLWVTQELWDFTNHTHNVYRRYCSNGTWLPWTKLETNLGELHLQHQQPSGTGGGYAGSTLNQFVDYPYNTEIKNTISGAYSISNKFYLPVGTYKISARARGQNSGNSLLLLHAYSGGANKGVRGDSCYAHGSADADVMLLTDEFQVVAAGEFVIRRWVTGTTGGSNDLGRPVTVGMNEIYGDLQIKKVA